MAKNTQEIDKTIEIIKDFKKGWLPYQIAIEKFSKVTGLSVRIAEVLFNEQRKSK
jgi:hypothetical protein|tara:strand:+ start:473 stop:637 length:165 start_codon:yes stop_codon:yes gene_type:complete